MHDLILPINVPMIGIKCKYIYIYLFKEYMMHDLILPIDVPMRYIDKHVYLWELSAGRLQ